MGQHKTLVDPELRKKNSEKWEAEKEKKKSGRLRKRAIREKMRDAARIIEDAYRGCFSH